MRRLVLLVPMMMVLAAAGCMRHAAPSAAADGSVPPASQQASAADAQPPTAQAQAIAENSYAAVPEQAAGLPLSNPDQPYRLDSGDKLRVIVFGQEGISGSYVVDAGGDVNVPLIGAVPARGLTTRALMQRIVARLRNGYVRDPHVTVAVETYRPFFILGEVTNPGQYPYVPQMTAENAVAIAGGFSPRAYKLTVELDRNVDGAHLRRDVPLDHAVRPGDTIVVKERWF